MDMVYTSFLVFSFAADFEDSEINGPTIDTRLPKMGYINP